MENFNVVIRFKGQDICFTIREIGNKDYLIVHKGKLLGNLLLDSRFEVWGSIISEDIANSVSLADAHGFEKGMGNILLDKEITRAIATQIKEHLRSPDIL